MSKVTVEFRTVEYTCNHGAEPRGRGSWAFCEERLPLNKELLWTPSLTYGEAKKWVREELAKRGVQGPVVLYVQP